MTCGGTVQTNSTNKKFLSIENPSSTPTTFTANNVNNQPEIRTFTNNCESTGEFPPIEKDKIIIIAPENTTKCQDLESGQNYLNKINSDLTEKTQSVIEKINSLSADVKLTKDSLFLSTSQVIKRYSR